MGKDKALNEAQMQVRIDKSASKYYDRYKRQMRMLQDYSPLARARRIESSDIYGLGQMLESWDTYVDIINEDGKISDLGPVPRVAHDVLTAFYGSSIIPLIGSVQPLDEEHGNVYFKNVKAVDTRGNVTSGDTLHGATSSPTVYQHGYASEVVEDEILVSPTIALTLTYAGTLATLPVRPRTLTVRTTNTPTPTNLRAIDDGEGNILGVGLQGTINYATGAWTLQFLADPLGGGTITATYGTDFEESGDVPAIQSFLDYRPVDAEVFALASEIGLFKNFALRKRFGKMGDEEMIQDLSNALTAEVGYRMTNKMLAEAVGVTPWVKTPPAGVAWDQHRIEFDYRVSQAEAKILTNAGRGVINVILAGSNICAIYDNLPNFEKAGISYQGPHLYGTYKKSIMVIRCPNFDPDVALAVYKGNGAFDTPVVYGPYMPLFLSNTLQHPDNILKTQGLAAVWAAVEVVVPRFITKIVVTA